MLLCRQRNAEVQIITNLASKLTNILFSISIVFCIVYINQFNTSDNSNIQQSGWLSSELYFIVNNCKFCKRANNAAEVLTASSFSSF